MSEQMQQNLWRDFIIIIIEKEVMEKISEIRIKERQTSPNKKEMRPTMRLI